MRSNFCPPYAGGQIFSVPLFIAREPLFLRASAFFLVDAVGQIPLALVLRRRISLFFSLLACGRVHKVGLVFMRVSWPSGAHRRQHQHSCGKRSNVLCCKLVEQRALRRDHVHERGNCRPVTVVGQCSNFAKQAPTNLVGKVRCR
jgi:hypothetical protein